MSLKEVLTKSIRGLAVGASLALLPGALLAQSLPAGLTAEDVDSFRSAVAGIGCKIEGPEAASRIQAESGLEQDKLRPLVGYLMQSGEMVELGTGRGLALVNADCPLENLSPEERPLTDLPAGLSTASVQVFRAGLTDWGCRADNRDQLLTLLDNRGIDRGKLDLLVEYLVGKGELVVDDGYVLKGGNCPS